MHHAAAGTFAFALLALSFAGCGLKGPLYMPDEKPETAAPSSGETQTTPTKRRTAPPAPQSQKEDAAAHPTPPPGG